MNKNSGPRYEGNLTAWPDNLIVGVENPDGSISKVSMGKGGHIWKPNSDYYKCPLCGETKHHTIYNDGSRPEK